ncbi:MAG TPA: PAS domain S-box protein [Blastocatellia bacterium]|nr:PAS domain S-box protein [Blastocatellia bacterium]
MSTKIPIRQALLAENADLRARLEEAEAMLQAIRNGEVDALVVGDQIYTLESADAASNRFRGDALTQVNEAVIAVDNDNYVTYLNPAAERLYEVTAADVLGHQLSVVRHNRWLKPEEEAAALTALQETGCWHGETIQTKRSGAEFHVESTISRLRDRNGAPTGHLVVIRDITERKQAEERLRAAHDTFRHLVEKSPFGIYVVDADFRLAQVSDGAQKVFANVRPLLGRDFAEVIRTIWPEPFASGVIAHFHHTLTMGETYHAPRTIEQRSDIGVVESYDWKIERVLLPDGRFGVVCHFYDLSERQRFEAELRASEERFRQAVDAANALIYEVDLQADKASVVYEMERVVGYRPEETPLTSAWWHSLIHPEDSPAYLARLEQHLERGGAYLDEYRVRHKSGKWIIVQDNGLVIKENNTAIRLIGAITDITERKETQEKLLAAEQRLRSEAEASARAKDEFVALVSHELRNPLNSILGYNRMLQQESVDEATRRKYTEIIAINARRQLTLLEDLLDTARMVSGKLKLDIRPLNFARVITDAVDAARPSAEAKQITLATDLIAGAAADITGDSDRLQQVVWNLLTNAIKFTPAGGVVIVVLAYEPGHLRLTVTDTGKGLTPAMLPYIFDRFRQADSSSTRRHGGLGLGLALVKQLVEMHGGTIEARSEGEGRGATFTVTLPLRAAPQLEEPATPHTIRPLVPSSRLTGIRVLVVDDEAEAREVIADILTAQGAQVTPVASASAAWQLLTNSLITAPDVLVSDINMPDMDGYELLRQVRRQGGTLPAIAVTALGRPEDRLRALTAGFQMHVPKPVEPEELVAVLCSLVRR